MNTPARPTLRSRTAAALRGPRRLSARQRTLAVCAAPLAALLAVAAFAPLPMSLAQPGLTANVLGDNKSRPVITVSGTDVPRTEDQGKLLMTTIAATPPGATVRLPEVVSTWFRTDRAVMPSNAVYPEGETTEQVEKHNEDAMRQSQEDAVDAALGQLHRSPDDVRVSLRLADVGGPSAGLLFSLGIIEKVDGDGRGGSLTGGRTIAGTGTIKADGTVGAVGGVPLKTKAAKRDGASVFLVPKAECAEAEAERPEGLRLVPVADLDGALDALKALKSGGRVPSC